METLKPKVRDDSLYLKCEGGNELDSDKQAIIVMTGGQTCGYISKNISQTLSYYSKLRHKM